MRQSYLIPQAIGQLRTILMYRISLHVEKVIGVCNFKRIEGICRSLNINLYFETHVLEYKASSISRGVN